MATDTSRRSFKDKAKERLASFRLKTRPSLPEITKSNWRDGEEGTASTDSGVDVGGHLNPLSWDNLPQAIRDKIESSSDTPSPQQETNGEKVERRTEPSRAMSRPQSSIEYINVTEPVSPKKEVPEKINKRRSRHVTQPRGTLQYTVSDRDTLTSMAAQFDTTPSELKNLNKLITTCIFPGQILFVPDKDYIPSPLPSPVPSPTEDKAPGSGGSQPGSQPPSQPPSQPGTPDIPLVRQVDRQAGRLPGHAERLRAAAASAAGSFGDDDKDDTPRPLSDDEARKLDQECHERFIKVNVKHITDGQGVVSGVLLVTPNAIMFDPNVSDPLVIEHGSDTYGMIAPMDTIISAAMYHDIAAMKLKGMTKEEQEEALKHQHDDVYHSTDCPMYQRPVPIGSEPPVALVKPPEEPPQPPEAPVTHPPLPQPVGERLPGDGRPGDGKPGDDRPVNGGPNNARAGDARLDDARPGDVRLGDTKPSDGRPVQLAEDQNVDLSSFRQDSSCSCGADLMSPEESKAKFGPHLEHEEGGADHGHAFQPYCGPGEPGPPMGTSTLNQDIHGGAVGHQGPHAGPKVPYTGPPEPHAGSKGAHGGPPGPQEPHTGTQGPLTGPQMPPGGPQVIQAGPQVIQAGLQGPHAGPQGLQGPQVPPTGFSGPHTCPQGPQGSAPDAKFALSSPSRSDSEQQSGRLSPGLSVLQSGPATDTNQKLSQPDGAIIPASGDRSRKPSGGTTPDSGSEKKQSFCASPQKHHPDTTNHEGDEPDDVFDSSISPSIQIARGPGDGTGILGRAVGSITSLGSSIASNSPNFSSIVDFSSGLFMRGADERGRMKDINEVGTPPRGAWALNEDGEPKSLDELEAQGVIIDKSIPLPPEPSPTLPAQPQAGGTTEESSDKRPEIQMENAVKIEEKAAMFKSLDELIPRPARTYDDPPLYLCLKVGKPINKRMSQTCPIESYMKKRTKPEYWFSIPRDKVDHLYAFFIQWSPNIYGSDDEMLDPKDRGFVVINDSDEDDDMDVVEDHFKQERRLLRQMTKDWEMWAVRRRNPAKTTKREKTGTSEIVNLEEARRRMSMAEDDMIAVPEFSDLSTILLEEHIKKIIKSLHARAEGNPWTLVYSSDKHGFSLKTLYRFMTSIDSPILLLVKDTNNQIFGALLSGPPKLSDHFYGTGESFLFTFYPEFKKFPWTGQNSFFIKGNADGLVVGAGEGSFGLWLDGDFYHGRTQTCQTFDNDLLTEAEDFVVKGIEAWAFL